MSITQTTVTLSDSQPAIQVTGLSSSAMYLRVKKTSSNTIQNGADTDMVISAQAYAVDASGVAIPPPCNAPAVGLTIHHGNPSSMSSALVGLATRAITAFINAYTVQSNLDSVPDILPL